jgi:hypothetical protein
MSHLIELNISLLLDNLRLSMAAVLYGFVSQSARCKYNVSLPIGFSKFNMETFYNEKI